MKRFLICLIAAVTASLAHAQIADGFYRVHNMETERYVYVYDNTGKINVSTTSADMGAIQLWKDHSRTITDPASVIYVQSLGGKKHNLHSQGTSVYEIIGYNVDIYPKDNAFQLYAQGRYLADDETSNVPDGQLGTIAKGDYRKWIVNAIDLEDNYFGVAPNHAAADKQYKAFFADFAFSFAGEGMKAYYISEVYKHIAVIKEITGDIVADNTPVIIECSSTEPSANKLNLFYKQGTPLQGNLLKGVYFNNERRPKSKDARTAYNAKTMRVLGLTSEGKLGFITSDQEYLAANEAYLPVTEDTPTELVLMTEDELAAYKENEPGESISGIKEEKFSKGIYSITGVRISEKTDIDVLPKGIYIVNGKKVIKP